MNTRALLFTNLLMCTGEGYVPRTLTQLYTWVILVFSNQVLGNPSVFFVQYFFVSYGYLISMHSSKHTNIISELNY